MHSVCHNHKIRSFPHSWFNTEFVTRVTRRMPHVEQDILTFHEHLSSPPVFSGVRVARSFIFCVMFCRSLFALLFFFFLLLCCLPFFDLLLLITPLVSSDYHFGIFWLPLWYLLITPLVSSDYHFGIFWLPLWYLLITPMVSFDYHFGIFWLPLWYLLITTMVSSDYHFGIFILFFSGRSLIFFFIFYKVFLSNQAYLAIIF
jgi:hypothetical protein